MVFGGEGTWAVLWMKIDCALLKGISNPRVGTSGQDGQNVKSNSFQGTLQNI